MWRRTRRASWGGGFTDTSNARSVGFEAKRAQLLAFWREVLGGRPMVVVAASLGASIAVDLFADTPEAFASLVMLDPATYTDPPPPVPEFAAKLLIDNVIGAPQVRESIAKQAYFNKPLQTEDAIRVGNLHVLRPQWSRDSVEWLLLGGYDVRESMPSLAVIPCLTLWGRDDEVIAPAAVVPQLVEALPSTTFRWVDECGHTPVRLPGGSNRGAWGSPPLKPWFPVGPRVTNTPRLEHSCLCTYNASFLPHAQHLEQPEVTATAIVAFIRGDLVPGDGDVTAVVARARDVERLRAGLSKLRDGARDAAASAASGLRERVEKLREDRRNSK